MITEKQKQIIRLLLTNKEGYNVNQIARTLDISVSWVHETLKVLEKEGLLVSARIANAIFFKLNWENPKTEKICDFILLDEKPLQQPVTVSAQKQEEVADKVSKVAPQEQNQSNQAFYNTQISNFRGYNTSSNTSSGSIESPYRQAMAAQGSNFGGYSTNPIGESGVNNVLFSYAKSGAFNNPSSGYSSGGSTYRGAQVPAGTLGSRISKNVAGYTLNQHTSAHKSTTKGCKYCG